MTASDYRKMKREERLQQKEDRLQQKQDWIQYHMNNRMTELERKLDAVIGFLEKHYNTQIK